jgi:hypothetical protein
MPEDEQPAIFCPVTGALAAFLVAEPDRPGGRHRHEPQGLRSVLPKGEKSIMSVRSPGGAA